MGLLYFFESIRMPVLNEFMLLITRLGEEVAFIVVAMILLWCVDKHKAYFILTVGFIGTIFNQFLKLMFRIPRPWVVDQNFTILEQAREAASGYSFPSGHTQCAVGVFGGTASVVKNKWIRIAAIAIAVLVSISRMYIGVHTPLDVGVSVLLALLLIVVLRPLFLKNTEKYFPIFLGIMLAMAIAYNCYVHFYPFPADIDPHNLESGLKNAYTMLGCVLGVMLVYVVDVKCLHFPTHAVWWAQIIKIVVGLGLILLVKEGTRSVLNFLLGEAAGRVVRYFLICAMGGAIWPMSFRWFAKLGTKEK